MNFNIENIWKEMEELGRSKQAAQNLFEVFQHKFYDRDSTSYYDKEECSPTRRLVQLKNAAAKHQMIGALEGIRDDRYALQYITCPDKSYIVRPEEGQIKYEDYTEKQTDKLIKKIIDGTV